MDLLDYIISYMNNKVEVASSLFDNIYGLCDVSKDNKYYSYTGKGQGKPVTDYDKKKGTLLWIKNGSVRITADAPQVLKDASCNDYVTIDYVLRGICVVKKSHLPCDNATAIDQAAQEILHKLGGKDKTLRQAIGASFIDIKPTGYTELKRITENLNYAAFGLDYTVTVVLKKSCIPQHCDDVPLPTCEFSVSLRNTDGKLIYTINEDSANPFTLAVQQVVDGNGNIVNVPYDPTIPYVTTACVIECEDATVNVNGNLFNTVASGGTLNVPVEYENGTPIGTIIGGVVEIPNPITCADATYQITDSDGNVLDSGNISSGGSATIPIADSVAVLKDTGGNIISNTNILAEGSSDVIAPDGTVTVVNSALTTVDSGVVLSGGSLQLDAPDATAVLKDTAGNVLDTEAIPSNVSEDITAPDGIVTVNSVAFDTVLSGGSLDVEVRQESGSTQVGSKQGQFWRIDDSDISINGSTFDSVAAEDSIDLDVQYVNGTPVGSDVGGVWTIPDPIQDLITKVDFDSGAPASYTITIDSDTAGTYTSATFGGSIVSATYEVNGSPDTLPFTVVATDTLEIIPDTDDGFVRLTGTY
jgi:hypothetical protein